MVKRGSVNDFGEERGAILQEVEMLIMSGDPPKVWDYYFSNYIFTILWNTFK